MEEEKRLLAQRLHELNTVQARVEQIVMEAIEEFEPEIYNDDFDLNIGSDWYDNSLEVDFLVSIPYPWEPRQETRKALYAMGFDIVYWNFRKDKNISIPSQYAKQIDTYDEIRGYEPRHYKDSSTWELVKGIGYVDNRFDEKQWSEKYKFFNK